MDTVVDTLCSVFPPPPPSLLMEAAGGTEFIALEDCALLDSEVRTLEEFDTPEDHAFFEIITVDFWWFFANCHPLCYCSDMLFSGHTFFATLYALGLYEVALIWTNSIAPKDEHQFSCAGTLYLRRAAQA